MEWRGAGTWTNRPTVPGDLRRSASEGGAREQLAVVVRENGAEILDDPRRVKAMLGDTIATSRREINLINGALSEGVPERLAAVAGDPLRLRAEIDTLIQLLVRNGTSGSPRPPRGRCGPPRGRWVWTTRR